MQEFHYDVWGKREFVKVYEDPYLPNWDLFGLTGRQGFTGHEMLDNVGLIHMNGRVYDPDVGLFISADPIVKAPTFTQSYNRYSYVWNNPLSLTDPSGFEPHGTGTDGYDAHPDYDSDSHSWDYSGGSDRNDAVATNHRVLDGGVIHLEPLIVDGNEYDYPTDGDGDGAQKRGCAGRPCNMQGGGTRNDFWVGASVSGTIPKYAFAATIVNIFVSSILGEEGIVPTSFSAGV